MEGKYAVSDDFFPPSSSLSLRLKMLLYLNTAIRATNEVLFILFRVYFPNGIRAVRSFLSIGLQWNKFEFRVNRMSSFDHISR